MLLARKKAGPGVWVDIGSGEVVTDSADTSKALRTWLPNAELAGEWRTLSVRKAQDIVEHVVKTKLKGYEQLTLFLRLCFFSIRIFSLSICINSFSFSICSFSFSIFL